MALDRNDPVKNLHDPVKNLYDPVKNLHHLENLYFTTVRTNRVPFNLNNY
jgi:hypothetical protein